MSEVLGQIERQQIAEFLGNYWGQDSPEEIADIRDSMNAVVIRRYMSDGPGYFGPIYFIVFGGGPEFHLVLTNYKNEGFKVTPSEFPPPIESHDSDSWDPNDSQIEHDPGCTGDPTRCDCFLHDKDEDCEGFIEEGCCSICGVGHGDPCAECRGTGYHREGCSLSDASYA